MKNSTVVVYRELVSRAEAAAAEVRDPGLRRLAFDRVLAHLLERAGRNRSGSDRRKDAAAEPGKLPRTGPLGYVDELVGEGFFADPRSIADVRRALTNRGRRVPVTSLSGPLQKLCQRKVLRREKGRQGGKLTFTYSNY